VWEIFSAKNSGIKLLLSDDPVVSPSLVDTLVTLAHFFGAAPG